MNQLHQIAYWTTVACVLFSIALGIGGIWLPKSETGWKLFMTAVTIGTGSLVVAAITKWLA